MSFSSGPVSFRRYFVSGRLPARVDDDLLRSISERVFGRQEEASADGIQVGWIAPRHLFDVEMAADKVAFDNFLYLQMRLDRTAPPGNVVRSYTRMEEAAALEASGKNGLSKAERKHAKELAQARADKEARAGLYRRISAYGVLIDLAAGVVYFGNQGSAAGDKLIELFRDTFDVSLEPATAGTVAHRIMEAAGDPRAVEDATPFHLVSPRDLEDNGFDFNDRDYFGREFLTWLWHATESREGMFQARGEQIAIAIAHSMQLDCDFRLTGRDVVRCDGPGSAPEARAALTTGKQPRKVGLLFSARAGDYGCVLDGPAFSVSSLRLPDAEQSDRRAILEERFKHISDAMGLLDALYGLFLGRRSSSDWPGELSAIKQWANPQQPRLRLAASAEPTAN